VGSGVAGEKMAPPARSTAVNLLGRLRRGGHSADEAHLREWTRGHAGVEAFIEPRTTVTETTMLLVAADGEWTRRRVVGPNAARKLAHRLAIPIYDAALVGYPQRMRDHDARERILRRRAQG
jgi:hypothetical protein